MAIEVETPWRRSQAAMCRSGDREKNANGSDDGRRAGGEERAVRSSVRAIESSSIDGRAARQDGEFKRCRPEGDEVNQFGLTPCGAARSQRLAALKGRRDAHPTGGPQGPENMPSASQLNAHVNSEDHFDAAYLVAGA